MHNPFLLIYDWFEKRRRLLYFTLFVLISLCTYFAVQIRLQENISSFFQEDASSETSVLEEFKLKDRILVMVSGTDPDLMIEKAGEFSEKADSLRASGLIKSVTTGVNEKIISASTDYIYDYLPIFLQDEDYARITSSLADSSIVQTVGNYYSMLTSPSGIVISDVLKRDPINVGTHLLKRFERFSGDFEYEMYDDYIFNKEMTTLYMYLEPAHGMADTGDNDQLVTALDQICQTVSDARVQVGCIGGPIVAVCNARQIKTDTYLTLSLALLILIPVLYLSFRNKRCIPLILLPPFFGALFALAVIAIIHGTISAIAIGAGAVVFGISLSYSIHIISHSNHTDSARDIIKDLSYPLTVGCFTTIGAFVALMFTHSALLCDMGLFASLTLIGTTIFSLVFLPHFIASGKKNGKSLLLEKIEKFNGYAYERNRLVLISVFAIAVIGLFTYDKVGFDSDMASMNYETPELQKLEQQASDILGKSSQQIYVVTSGKDYAEVTASYSRLHRLLQSLEQDSLIVSSVDVCDFVVPEEVQKERIARWNAFWTQHKSRVMSSLVKAGNTYGFNEQAFDGFHSLITRPYNICQYHTGEMGQPMLLTEWIDRSPQHTTLVSRISIHPQHKDRVYGQISQIDHTSVMDRAYFSSKMVKSTSDDFNFILLVSSLLVFFTLFLTYGRIEITLLTFLPMCISWVIILGFMSIFGIRFNIVNIILATFIFGIGDDFSIFTMDGLLARYKNGTRLFEAHKSAIFFSALTTVIGMGVLIFARHPALQSIAVISVLGLCVVVLVAYTIQPYLFNLLISHPVQKGRPPYTLASLCCTVYAFVYFALGCILLQVVYAMLYLWPVKKSRKEQVFHYVIWKSVRLFLKSMYMVKIHRISPEQLNFTQPSVLIANHQSFIDILLLLSLSPKIVMVTKGWVWNSPVFGQIVRHAGFHSIDNGYDELVTSLRPLIAEGYSVVIFPEGTRSADGEIQRFHKGAFYLAEKLCMDLTPIVIYGAGHISSKRNPFYISHGEIAVKVLPRLSSNDLQMGTTYQERSKAFRKLYIRQYDRLKTQYDRASNVYFRKALIRNFIYMGPVLEWYMRVKCAMDGYYNFWDRRLSRNARIVDIGCGYGQLSFMLALLSPQREVIGVDYDESKIELANHSYLSGRNVRFVQGNMQDIVLPQADAFIFNDSLHYVNGDVQQRILEHCIDRLRPDGMIIIREGDSSQGTKHQSVIHTEKWSTQIIRFNRTTGPLNFISSSWMRQFAESHQLNLKIEQCDKSTSQTIYMITKK